MKTAEILAEFLRGEELATISQKQRDWLHHQAKREGLLRTKPGYESVMMDDSYYNIYTAPGGHYRLERFYAIRFTGTAQTQVCRHHDLDGIRQRGRQFQIIKPATILK